MHHVIIIMFSKPFFLVLVSARDAKIKMGRKFHFGRLVRSPGSSQKTKSATSDSIEARLNRESRIEEENLIYQERLDMCRNKFEHDQSKIDVSLARNQPLRSRIDDATESISETLS